MEMMKNLLTGVCVAFVAAALTGCNPSAKEKLADEQLKQIEQNNAMQAALDESLTESQQQLKTIQVKTAPAPKWAGFGASKPAH